MNSNKLPTGRIEVNRDAHGNITGAVISHASLLRVTIRDCDMKDIAIHGCVADRVSVDHCMINDLVGLGFPYAYSSEFNRELSKAEGTNLINGAALTPDVTRAVETRTAEAIATWIDSVADTMSVKQIRTALRTGAWRKS